MTHQVTPGKFFTDFFKQSPLGEQSFAAAPVTIRRAEPRSNPRKRQCQHRQDSEKYRIKDVPSSPVTLPRTMAGTDQGWAPIGSETPRNKFAR